MGRRAALASIIVPTSDDQLAVMRADVRARAADRPGVYRMVAPDGEVLYVGKSKRVRTRLLSYFRCAYPDDKGARLLRQSHAIDWEYVPSEFAALLAELRMIKRLRPRFNVSLRRDDRHFAFIKLSSGPAPKLLVVRHATDDTAVYYGPFHGAQRVGEALRELSDVLGLRDCSLDHAMHFADQHDLFPIQRTPGCIRYEIHRCLGPCVAACTQRQYAERVRLARAFLDGDDDGPIESLRRDMAAAADRLDYERAASLRDKLHRLEGLRAQFHRLRFAIDTLTFLYQVPGVDGDDRVYVIRRGRVRGEDAAPRSRSDRARLRALVDSIFGDRDPDPRQLPTHEIDELMLLSSWFRRFPAEMERTSPIDASAHHPRARRRYTS